MIAHFPPFFSSLFFSFKRTRCTIQALIAGLATSATARLANATGDNAILSAQVASLIEQVYNQGEVFRQMLVEKQAANIATLDDQIATLNRDAAARTAGIERAVEHMTADAAAAQSTAVVQMATLANSLSRSVSTQMAAGTATIAAVNRTASASLVGKMNTRKHHWTGGCSGHRNGGWNWCKCRNITGCVPAALEGRRAAR